MNIPALTFLILASLGLLFSCKSSDVVKSHSVRYTEQDTEASFSQGFTTIDTTRTSE
jgi:hypothetical protein